MPTIKLTPEFLAQLKELTACWGKSAAKRAAAELGPDPPIDFMDIETFAALVADGVAAGVVKTLFDQKAEGLARAACPDCGTNCKVEHHDRAITLGTGQVVPIREPICYCPQCRRDFFPPPDRLATG